MKTYHGGTIVLLSFPFTDHAGGKKRPALILMDTKDGDVLIARITSHKARNSFDIEIKKWEEGGLLLPSVIRTQKIATIQKDLIQQTLGSLGKNDWIKVKGALQQFWKSLP